MIVKLALAALISGFAIPALAIHHFAGVEDEAGLVVQGADATVATVGSVGRSGLGPFLSGLI
jgi:hypothetical protein